MRTFTISAVVTIETLVIVYLLVLLIIVSRANGVRIQPQATTSASVSVRALTSRSSGPLAPRSIDEGASYTTVLLVDVDDPLAPPSIGQEFDACAVDKANAAKCIHDLILLQIRCGGRNSGQCSAQIALPRKAEEDLAALVGGGQSVHLFIPRRR